MPAVNIPAVIHLPTRLVHLPVHIADGLLLRLLPAQRIRPGIGRKADIQAIDRHHLHLHRTME